MATKNTKPNSKSIKSQQSENTYLYAFDLSMDNSGISIFDCNHQIVHISSIKTNPKESHGKRLKVIAKHMMSLKQQYPPFIAIFERGFSRFAMSTQVIYRVVGITNLLFEEVEQIYYPPKKVKEAILNGKATKKQVQDEIIKRFPEIVFNNEDESDAVAVGICHLILTENYKWK